MKRGIKFKMSIIRVGSFMSLKDMRIMAAHFNVPNMLFLFLFHSSIEVESMSCDQLMNQNEIIASISFYKNKRLIVSYNNIYLYPAFSKFCIICSYYSNERLVMFLPNMYSGLL